MKFYSIFDFCISGIPQGQEPTAGPAAAGVKSMISDDEEGEGRYFESRYRRLGREAASAPF